jgi:hypothetical protein
VTETTREIKRATAVPAETTFRQGGKTSRTYGKEAPAVIK